MLFVRVVLRLVANFDTFLEIAFQFILLMLCRGQFQVPEEEGECTPLVLVRIATHSTPYTKHRTHHMFTHNKVLFSSMYARPLLSVLFSSLLFDVRPPSSLCSLCSPCSPCLFSSFLFDVRPPVHRLRMVQLLGETRTGGIKVMEQRFK